MDYLKFFLNQIGLSISLISNCSLNQIKDSLKPVTTEIYRPYTLCTVIEKEMDLFGCPLV